MVALKFNIGQKQNKGKMDFQKLIQTSLVHEYNFTKANISAEQISITGI